MTRYARQVLAGDPPAGRWVRLACERHLRDLEDARWRWRPELAVKAVKLFQMFRHHKGEWAGQPFRLELWQQFIIGSLLGWVHVDTGLRRYRNAFLELCRGQGKSTLAAGLLILLTFFDNEPGAEGYCIATKKDQARIVFRTARQMVLRSSPLREFITVWRHNLHDDDTESKAEALGADADTLDGLRPHIAIADEVHKHSTPDLIEVIESGMGTRRQPLLFEITTAGEADGTETVYGQHYGISTQVLEGAVDLPDWFAFIAAADPDDDWTLETTWRRANPNWGVSVKPEFIAKECRKALANPSEQPKFRRLYLGQRVEQVDAYLSLEAWDACPPLPPDEELRPCPCWIGLDLSSSVDVTAAVLVWRLAPERIAVRPMFWLPEVGLDSRRQRDRVPLPAWVQQGALHLTPGNTIDRAVVRRAVRDLAVTWGAQAICFDPWGAGEMTQALQDEDGLRLLEVRQRVSELSEPTKRLRDLVLQHGAAHDGNPMLRWMVSNVVVREDDQGNVMPSKRRSTGRIDGVQALITAIRGMVTQAPAASLTIDIV